jgi:hypothetical protein
MADRAERCDSIVQYRSGPLHLLLDDSNLLLDFSARLA